MVIIMAMVLTGMQSTTAQRTVIVPFIVGDCDCPTPGEFIYRVDVAVVDQLSVPVQFAPEHIF